MFLLSINLQLPVTDPTWIFFLVLSVILFAPMLFEKLHIPSIIGLIIAGIIIGNHGFNILNYDSSFKLFGKVGIYYIMFLAGLEMNMSDFKKNRNKIITYGFLTFIVPMVLGVITGLSVLQYAFFTSVLLACMFASHTLITYPIVIRYGLSRQRSVGMAVGATAITDTLTLLILAIVGGLYKGDATGPFLAWLLVKIAVLFTMIIVFFPRIARWFFRKYNDNVTQFVFVLAMVFLGAGMMEFVGMEGILGAFLTGLVLNRYIPHVSPLMSHLEFVGNALFIPYFLIGVGMIMNIRLIVHHPAALWVAGVMIVVALFSKWLAAYIAQKLFKLKAIERRLIYGLSNARAAATLAVVMVGYNIILKDNQRLLNDDILNGTILLILVTCILSSFVTEDAARRLTLSNTKIEDDDKLTDKGACLISYANLDKVEPLTQIAMMMCGKLPGKMLLGLNVVVDNEKGSSMLNGKRCLNKAAKIAATANIIINPLVRVSTNVITGIVHTMKEHEASELIVGLPHQEMTIDSLGNVNEALLKGTHKQIMMIRCTIPPSTLRRIIVAVPPKAEYEVGFYKWLKYLCLLEVELGCKIHFYVHPNTLTYIKSYINTNYESMPVSYSILERWYDIISIEQEINYDHLFVIVSARKGFMSYQSSFEHLPQQISKYFNHSSLMLLFPEQYGDPMETPPSLFSPKI